MSVGKYGKVKNIVVLHLKRDHFDQWPPLPPCGNSQPVESFQTEMKKRGRYRGHVCAIFVLEALVMMRAILDVISAMKMKFFQ